MKAGIMTLPLKALVILCGASRTFLVLIGSPCLRMVDGGWWMDQHGDGSRPIYDVV